MKTRTKRLAVTYATILLIPYIFAVCIICITRNHDISFGGALSTSLLSIFGPLSPQASIFAGIPHAGELDYTWLFPISLGLLAGLIIPVRASIKFNKKWITILSISTYTPLAILWIFLGMGLMASYLR